jgi:hypothetical protein
VYSYDAGITAHLTSVCLTSCRPPELDPVARTDGAEVSDKNTTKPEIEADETDETDLEGHSIDVEEGDADMTNFNVGCCS